MFKKLLLSLSMMGLFAAANPLHSDDLDAYANYYSVNDQELTLGEAVVFENQNEVKKFTISDDRKTVICRHHGVYLITYNAVGERNEIDAPDDDSYGRWGLALTLNGNIVPGSSTNVEPYGENTSFLGGQVIIQLKKNDQIRLVNNTHGAEQDFGITIVGGYEEDISASLVFVHLDD